MALTGDYADSVFKMLKDHPDKKSIEVYRLAIHLIWVCNQLGSDYLSRDHHILYGAQMANHVNPLINGEELVRLRRNRDAP